MNQIYTIISIRPKPLRAGGEENDISAGLEIYKDIADNVIAVTINNSVSEISHDFMKLKSKPNRSNPKNTNWVKFLTKFLLLKLIICDPYMRENTKFSYCLEVQNLINKFPSAIVINETSGMFPLSIFSRRRVSRSNNFEPLHSFRENRGLKRYFYLLPKISGVILERWLSNILTISYQDMNNYKKFWSPKRLSFLPLRHLILANKNTLYSKREFIGGVAYLSSTFNVKHNKDGVEFFVNKVFNKDELSNVILNIYGAKTLKSFERRNVIVHGWVDDIEDIYTKNSIFLSAFGGTGQQSKIFEPMCRGKVVICNPRLVEGQNLIAGTHYLPALYENDYLRHILDLTNNPDKLHFIGRNAFDFCADLFSYEKNIKTLVNFLNIS